MTQWNVLYSVANDTLNGAVDTGSLYEELIASTVTVQLLNVRESGGSIDLTYAVEPSASEKTTITAIVAAHTGEEQSYQSEVNVTHMPAFADKTVGDLKLFNRTTGKKFSVAAAGGSEDLKFEIPFAQMKFNGIEIINGEIGDCCNLYVWDSVAGTYTGIGSYQLNQFGYAVNVAEKYFRRISNYDADVFFGMQIVVEFDSISDKDIYVNYDIHELKA